ncbi:hypothetical protein BKA62DRAFT_672803 [Auriculariales sp. MPI-PUGE-AT-0066]|nr:hypothetical protein BKA62DRAFT_672803 [Auriculariales sp. MPI-PUGE-AT-0066]
MTSRLATQKRAHKLVYNFQKRQASDCTTETLYQAPLKDAVVDSLQPLTVSWDTSCFPANPPTIDLRLYMPHAQNISERRLTIFKEVPFAPGSYQVELYPRWWENAPSVELQFSIAPSTNPLASDFGIGPIFTATYDGTATEKADLSIIDTGYTWVKNIVKSMSGGQIAGAVIGSLLFIVLLVGGIFFVRRSRAAAAKKSKRFSQKVDNRMSTISHNWSSMSASGAQAAIRNSMSVYGRPSGDISGFQSSVSINQAADGHTTADDASNTGNTVGSGLRPQRERSGTRVSFAPESMYGRPSSSIRGSVAAASSPMRPYHYADAPPVPTRQNTDNMTLSPTQAVGAFDLSPQDVDARASQYNPELMPALQLMRESEGSHELMFSPKADTPLPPVPAVTNGPKSPMGMMPMLDSSLSPDVLMRGYASKGRMNSLSINTRAPRTLYTPQTPTTVDNNPFRKSMALTIDSVYSGAGSHEQLGHLQVVEAQQEHEPQLPKRF